MMWVRNERRRGGMYLAVLMTATIVAIIGMSALAATRAQLRSAAGGNNVTAARFGAQSAIETGFFAIRSDAAWRTRYTHDTWAPEQTLGEVAFSWKLVDEQNADLAANAEGRVYLYGKGMVGSAVRIYSVLLEPAYLDESNWLSNPGFESGTSDWTGETDCILEARTDGPHAGTTYLRARSRTNMSAGPWQLIGSPLENGKPYDTEVWAKMKDVTEDIVLALWLRTDLGWTKLVCGTAPAEKVWTCVSASFTPTWSGTLYEAYWKVETASSNQDFNIDDAALRRARVNSNMLVVPGTWQRAVE
jgi:hypothetical protein